MSENQKVNQLSDSSAPLINLTAPPSSPKIGDSKSKKIDFEELQKRLISVEISPNNKKDGIKINERFSIPVPLSSSKRTVSSGSTATAITSCDSSNSINDQTKTEIKIVKKARLRR